MKANRNRQATLPHDQDNGNSLKEEHHHPDWKTTTRRAVPPDQTAQPREAANADLLAANDPIGTEPRLSLIPIGEVMKRTAIGRTKVYELIKSNEFPQPVKVCGASRWVSGEISDWIQSLMSKRKQRL